MKHINKSVIFLILGIFIISGILLISYGYMGAKVSGNETAKKFASLSQVLKIQYSGGDESLSTSYDGYFMPGSVITKTFSLKNTGNVNLNYAIKLIEVENDFERVEDLVYELYLNDTLLISDTFPNYDKVVAYNQTINKGETKNYTLKIIYKESEENQIVDQDKLINAKIDFIQTKNRISNIKILGNSIQETKNLLPYPYDSKNTTLSGVQITTNIDGSITLNGTATAGNSSFSLISSTKPIKLKAGTYTISGNHSNAKLWLREVGSGNVLVNSTNGNSGTLTLEKDTNIYCYISFDKGEVFNNDIIYPQIEEGNVATEWISQVPSPTNPIAIKSVGDKTVNLFDINNAVNSCLINNEDGSYSMWKNSSCRFAKTVSISIPANTTFTMQYYLLEYNGTYGYPLQMTVKFADGSGTIISFHQKELNKTHSKTYTFDKEIINISLYQEGQMPLGTYTKFKDFMISIGSDPKTYEPYGKYKIPMKMISKNLFNINEFGIPTKTTNGLTFKLYGEDKIKITGKIIDTSINTQYFIENYNSKLTLNPGTYVTNNNTVKVQIGTRKINGGGFVANLSEKKTIINEPVQVYYYQIYIPAGTTREFNDIIEIQLEKGDVASNTYEPFEKTYNIYLNEPLRKVNECEGCYDYLSFDENNVTRNLQKKVFQGTENFHKHTMNNFPEIYYESGNQQLDSKKTLILSNYFKGVDREYLYKIGGEIISENGTIRIHSDSLITSTSTNAEFKTWVKSKYDEGNPFYTINRLPSVEYEEVNIPNIYSINPDKTLTFDTEVPATIVTE